LPVVPGTALVTIGGAVAANIHGKNHHKHGSIANYIRALDLLVADGTILECSEAGNKELFRDTIGGMGLTGIITTVTIQLIKIETTFIKQRTVTAKGVRHLLALLQTNNQYTYSVAWIDCNTPKADSIQSLLFLGEHVTANEIDKKQMNHHTVTLKSKFTIPFYFPSFLLNKLSSIIFNKLYYYLHKNENSSSYVPLNKFFFPLDTVTNWNLIYGKEGFLQYQFVIPFENAAERFEKFLRLSQALVVLFI